MIEDRATPLHELARLHGVETAYHDIAGVLRPASPEALLPILRALGAPLGSLEDVEDALRARRLEIWRRPIPPAAVVWDGAPAAVRIHVPSSSADGAARVRIVLENGEVRTSSHPLDDLPVIEHAELDGTRHTALRLPIPPGLPAGYHTLELVLGRKKRTCLLISAPTRCFAHPSGSGRGDWGVFVPLHALRSRAGLGTASFTDLEELIGWLTDLGGGVAGTLPLLASFLDDPFEPSPYAPASRLFWNEFFLDLSRAPEMARCAAARARIESPAYREAAARLRQSGWVDYRAEMEVKRQILDDLAAAFFSASSHRRKELDRFLAEHPRADDYARFRAAGERQRAPWGAWPYPMRDGEIADGDFDDAARRRHLYAQLVARDQLESLASRARARGPGLYLDLPLGVHPDSYDVWRERALHAMEISVGAPPDPLGPQGQNWGIRPLHPERIREEGYRYVIDSLRNQMRYAGVLRIDHVMALHRLLWIPFGMDAAHGIYVTYPAEELHAIYSLESHRARCMLVGEDLGTVPDEVRHAMDRHGLHRMYVAQFSVKPDPARAIDPVPPNTVASVNTHDTPTFAGFVRGLDIEQRLRMGHMDAAAAQREQDERRRLVRAVVERLNREGRLADGRDVGMLLRDLLLHLASGPARLLIVTLEDLWQETEPQNVPGTVVEQPNWRRRARYALDEFRAIPELDETLRAVDAERRRAL